MNTIEELIRTSHEIAVSKGWWTCSERSVVEQVNNFHAEISEAHEEWRAGRIETWWSMGDAKMVEEWRLQSDADKLAGGWTPSGFWAEIADLCIRLADTMGAYGWSRVPRTTALFNSLPQFIWWLHSEVSAATNEVGDWTISARSTLQRILATCFVTARANAVDLWPIIDLKTAYDRTRPQRHGGKKA